MTDPRSPVRLHQFPRVWGRNISPFTLKLESWLTLAKIPFEIVETINPRAAPKGKIPFIEDGEQAIGDSSLVIEHLVRTRGVDLDDGLDADARAEAVLLQRLFEEHLYFIGAYSRWIDPDGWRTVRPALFASIPPGAREVVAAVVRRKIRRDLMGQGILRHEPREIYAMAAADLEAVAVLLDDGPFFFRGRPHTIDCIAYGGLANILMVPVETELKRIAGRFANLRQFCQAMEQEVAAARVDDQVERDEPALI
ncbi:MAG: glutathione S-transferase family protein [Geminicoccaceae bacterium]|nr:glutathione S-transferase family protein [Geminicoccaceae bacterium]